MRPPGRPSSRGRLARDVDGKAGLERAQRQRSAVPQQHPRWARRAAEDRRPSGVGRGASASLSGRCVGPPTPAAWDGADPKLHDIKSISESISDQARTDLISHDIGSIRTDLIPCKIRSSRNDLISNLILDQAVLDQILDKI